MPAPKYRLHANRVDRIAIVDRPCVPDAEIVLFKRLEDPVNGKEGLLPIADRLTDWSPEEAFKRVKEWATDGENFKRDEYGKAFMKTEPEHGLQIADVIDGKLVAIPKAIFAIVQNMESLKNLDKEERKAILDKCEKYYDALGLGFPVLWAKYLEKGITLDFYARAVPNLIDGAINAIVDKSWSIIFGEGVLEEKVDSFRTEYKSFRNTVSDILTLADNLITDVQDQRLATQEVAEEFTKELTSATPKYPFASFWHTLQSLFASRGSLENPEEAIIKVLDAFEDFMIAKVLKDPERQDDLRKQYEAGWMNEVLETEKVGRKISSARLKKIKDAIEALQEIIKETETKTRNKSQKEAEEMEIKELSDKLDKISADVGSINSRMTHVENILKEHNMLLTDEEKEKIKAEETLARKKAEEVEKKAEEAKALAKKAEKERIEVEKKLKEEEKARLEKIEKELTEMSKVMEKRLGVKTSLEKDGGDTDTEKRDVFGDTLRGKK